MFPLFHPSLLSAAALLGMAGNFNQTGTDGQPCCGGNPCNECDPPLLNVYSVSFPYFTPPYNGYLVYSPEVGICDWTGPYPPAAPPPPIYRLTWSSYWEIFDNYGHILAGPAATPCDPTGTYTDGTNTAVVS